MCGATIFCERHDDDGRALRVLVVIDEYTRECLVLRVARRLGSLQVIEMFGLGCDCCCAGSQTHLFAGD